MAWLRAMQDWLAELLRVAWPERGRLCLNLPGDRDLGGWQPVSADAIHVACAAGWQFRTWLIWDKDRRRGGGRRQHRLGRRPNVTAPVESVLALYRGQWQRSGPAAMPHQAWLELCGPRGLRRFPGTSDAVCSASLREQLPERCITLFSFRVSSAPPGQPVAGHQHRGSVER